MSSGIDPTRTESGDHWTIGYGIPWASGAADEPERPVWFYGLREDVPLAHPLRDRFPSIEQVLESAADSAAKQWRGDPRRWHARLFPRRPFDLVQWCTGSPDVSRRLVSLRPTELAAACRIPDVVVQRYTHFVTVDECPVAIVEPTSCDNPFFCLVDGRHAVVPGTTPDLFTV